jgi:transposase-like protein
VTDDKNIIGKEMKRIFDGSSEEEARKRFNEFKETWNNRYAEMINNTETRQYIKLTYCIYYQLNNECNRINDYGRKIKLRYHENNKDYKFIPSLRIIKKITCL